MPKVSVIIPTHNRSKSLRRAIRSVLAQTYQDFEVIIVDDGVEQRAEKTVKQFNDERIIYIQHKKNKGGAAARNTGIKNAKGEFVAFLDDDDEWLSAKLEIQVSKFENTSDDVGFCFTAVKNIYDDKEEITEVPEGIDNYFELALRRLKGFLTVTLVIKKFVFEKAGYFDERFPSHQEPDLMIRITRKYKGLGINQSLVNVNMSKGYERIGGNLKRRIEGRKMILRKYYSEFKKRPKILAKHYFQVGLWHRDDKQYKQAKKMFKKARETKFKLKYLLHYWSMILNGGIYKIIKK